MHNQEHVLYNEIHCTCASSISYHVQLRLVIHWNTCRWPFLLNVLIFASTFYWPMPSFKKYKFATHDFAKSPHQGGELYEEGNYTCDKLYQKIAYWMVPVFSHAAFNSSCKVHVQTGIIIYTTYKPSCHQQETVRPSCSWVLTKICLRPSYT